MNYCETFFNKTIYDLELQDIIDLFERNVEESDILEVKSYSEKENQKENEKKVLRTICGFLNSNGGIMIWGGPREEKIENETKFSKTFSPVEYKYSKDDFNAKIVNRITPSPVEFGFKRFDLDGKFIYLIEVNRGIARPYQFQNIYYMRIDGATRAAPHHYIEALFKQINFPVLEAHLELRKFQYIEHHNLLMVSFNVFINNLSKLQNEKNLSIYIVVNNTYLIKDEEAEKICFFGKPVIKIYESLRIKSDMKVDLDFELQLLFGGELSPIRSSVFKFKFEKPIYNLHTQQMGKAELNIISRDENKYSYERV